MIIDFNPPPHSCCRCPTQKPKMEKTSAGVGSSNSEIRHGEAQPAKVRRPGHTASVGSNRDKVGPPVCACPGSTECSGFGAWCWYFGFPNADDIWACRECTRFETWVLRMLSLRSSRLHGGFPSTFCQDCQQGMMLLMVRESSSSNCWVSDRCGLQGLGFADKIRG